MIEVGADHSVRPKYGENMSKSFPNNKDHIIDELDERYGLQLDDADYDRLRKLTEAELLLVTMLMSRAVKNCQPCG